MYDYRDLMNVLSSRGVDPRCAACGEDDWAHGDHLLAMLLVDENRNLKTTGGVSVAAFLCRNCGYVRLFAPDAIRGFGVEES